MKKYFFILFIFVIFFVSSCSLIFPNNSLVACYDENVLGKGEVENELFCYEGYWRKCESNDQQIKEYCCSNGQWKECITEIELEQSKKCDFEYKLLNNQKFVCINENGVFKARECTGDRIHEIFKMHGFLNFECINEMWTLKCSKTGDLLAPKTFNNVQGDWYICNDDYFLQCNLETNDDVIKGKNRVYKCDMERGWIEILILNDEELKKERLNEILDVDWDKDGIIDCTDEQLNRVFQIGINSDIILDHCDYDPTTPSCDDCEVYQGDEVGDKIHLIGTSKKEKCNCGCTFINPSNIKPKLQIIFVPCNYGITEIGKTKFEEDVQRFYEYIKIKEPFVNYPNEYQITNIWSERKKEGDMIKNDDDKYDFCRVDSTTYSLGDQTVNDKITREIASLCPKTENVIIIQLVKSDYYYGGGYSNWEIDEISGNTLSLGHSFIGNAGNEVLITHELGHSFKFFHTNFLKTKVSNEVIKYFKKSEILNWNAYYHPDIPTSSFKNRKPVDQNKVCPIWSHLPKDRFKCHRIGELDRNGEPEYNWNMGCFPHHTRDSTNDESYKNEFSPCGNDVMGYGHRYSDDYYNPIQIYYLEKIFELGYKNYLIEEYPHRCSDLDDLDVKNSCLKEECSYIELGEVDTSGEYYDDEGFEYKDYINYMFEKTGMEADTAREACCNQILDEDLKALCNSDEIASNAVVEQRNI